MLSVSHIEELDISSLCDTRVQGELNISTYALYIMFYVSQSFVIPSSCNECMQGSQLNVFLFMNVYRTYIFIVDLFFTRLLMIDKKGENDFEFIYTYLEIEFIHILSLCMFYVYKKKGRRILKVYTKRGRKVFEEKTFFLFLSPCLCIYICLVLCTSFNI